MSMETERYSRVAIVLHWAIAAFIFANLTIGMFMEGLDNPLRGKVVRLHESFGFSVFVLTLCRIAWRLTHRPPPLPDHYPAWEKLGAHAAHFALYFLMLTMPIAGWLIISSNLLRPMVIYWSFDLPPFYPVTNLPKGPDKTALHDQFVLIHSIGAWILIALLLLHVGAALKHQFRDKDPELQRMGIGRRRQPDHPVP